MNLSDIRRLRANLDRHPKLKQFPAPKTWEKLQKEEYEFNMQNGYRDNRVDCVINSLAFVGAMERNKAEKESKIVNARQFGIHPTDVASYLESNDGYEKNPHVVLPYVGGGLEMAFKELKNEYATLIYLSRLSGVGHMATIVRLNGKLMVFDPQVECICHNIGDWLDKEGASYVGAIFVLGKHVHCREQTNVCVSKDKSPVSKRVKMQAEEAMIPRWKPKEVRKRKKRIHIPRKERAFNHFKNEMTRLGFERYLD